MRASCRGGGRPGGALPAPLDILSRRHLRARVRELELANFRAESRAEELAEELRASLARYRHLRGRVLELELSNFRAESRAEELAEELRASQARERYLIHKLSAGGGVPHVADVNHEHGRDSRSREA